VPTEPAGSLRRAHRIAVNFGEVTEPKFPRCGSESAARGWRRARSSRHKAASRSDASARLLPPGEGGGRRPPDEGDSTSCAAATRSRPPSKLPRRMHPPSPSFAKASEGFGATSRRAATPRIEDLRRSVMTTARRGEARARRDAGSRRDRGERPRRGRPRKACPRESGERGPRALDSGAHGIDKRNSGRTVSRPPGRPVVAVPIGRLILIRGGRAESSRAAAVLFPSGPVAVEPSRRAAEDTSRKVSASNRSGGGPRRGRPARSSASARARPADVSRARVFRWRP